MSTWSAHVIHTFNFSEEEPWGLDFSFLKIKILQVQNKRKKQLPGENIKSTHNPKI